MSTLQTSEEPSDFKQVPMWAWVLVAACALIPITAIGGLVPTVLGAGGALTVLGLARNPTLPANRRLGLSIGMTLLVWCMFVGFSYAVNEALGNHQTTTHKVVRTPTDLSDEATRKKVFASVARSLAAIDEARDKITELRRQGKDTAFYRKRLTRREEAHERNRDFAAKLHKISRAEVDTIVNEAIAENWPVKKSR